MAVPDEVQVDPKYAAIIERILAERMGIVLGDLDEAQCQQFLLLIAAELTVRARRDRAIGATPEVQGGSDASV